MAQDGTLAPTNVQLHSTHEIHPILEKCIGHVQLDLNPVFARALQGPGPRMRSGCSSLPCALGTRLSNGAQPAWSITARKDLCLAGCRGRTNTRVPPRRRLSLRRAVHMEHGPNRHPDPRSRCRHQPLRLAAPRRIERDRRFPAQASRYSE